MPDAGLGLDIYGNPIDAGIPSTPGIDPFGMPTNPAVDIYGMPVTPTMPGYTPVAPAPSGSWNVYGSAKAPITPFANVYGMSPANIPGREPPPDTWGLPTRSNTLKTSTPEEMATAQLKFNTLKDTYMNAYKSGDWQTAGKVMPELLGMMGSTLTTPTQTYGTLLDLEKMFGSRLDSPLPPMPSTFPLGGTNGMPNYFTNPPSKLPQMTPMAAWAIQQLFSTSTPVNVPTMQTRNTRTGRVANQDFVNQSWSTGNAALADYNIVPPTQTGTDKETGKPTYSGGQYGQSYWYLPKVTSSDQYKMLEQSGALPFLNAYLKDVGQINPDDYWGQMQTSWPVNPLSSGKRNEPTYRMLPQR